MFEYVTEEEALKIVDSCDSILNTFKENVKKFFDVEYKLLGIKEKSLLTKDNSNGLFDVFYTLVVLEDYHHLLLDHPVYVKNIFINALNKANPGYNFDYILNKSLIECRLIFDNGLNINFDIAIMYKYPNGTLSKLFCNERLPYYIWYKIKDTKDLEKKYARLVEEGHYKDIKDSYILKKNNYYINNAYTVSSFFILLESINELWNQYNYTLEL